MMPNTIWASSCRTSPHHRYPSVHLNAPSIRSPRPPHAVADRYDQEHVSAVYQDRQFSAQRVAQREDAPASARTHSRSLETTTASATWLLSGSQPRHTLRDALSRSPSLPGGKAGAWAARTQLQYLTLQHNALAPTFQPWKYVPLSSVQFLLCKLCARWSVRLLHPVLRCIVSDSTLQL